MGTPGEDVNGNDEDEPELNKPEEVKSFRADGASSNCSCMVRPDQQFSAKGTKQAMSKPTKKDRRRMIKMTNYLERTRENKR